MIQLLSRFFIKNYKDTKSPEVRQAYGILCGAVGIGFNILLFIGKFLAGLFSNSIAITADAFNNLSDAGSSLITLVGFKMSGQEPDPDHPFGHGRIEYITGLLVSIIILIMGFELITTSVEKIRHPEALIFQPLILIILLVSIAVKLYMNFYNRSVAAKIDSAAMRATAADSFSDSIATALVLLSTLISHYTGLHIDGWCGVLVGLFICYTGYESAKETISPLLGQPPEPEFVTQVEQLVLSYDLVLGIHDMIVHNYGPGRTMISLHAEVPADGDLLTMHDTIDNIERRLQKELHCSAVIHMDPVVNNDEKTEKLKASVLSAVKELDKEISMHDFRIVEGPTHTNIIFDVVVPFHFRLSDSEIRSFLQTKISQLNPSYFAVINIDKSYSGS